MLPWTTWIQRVAMVTHPATPQTLSLKYKRPRSYHHHKQALRFIFLPLWPPPFFHLLGIDLFRKLHIYKS